MTDKQIIYYKKDCFNEPYCSLEKVIEQFDLLKVENEELKNEIEACYNQVEDFDIIATSKSNKLKQAEQKLEKIKQIVNKLSLSINWNINKNAYEKLQSILQIIDEVENE